eukprot:Nk52_evm1s1192 gene=Nk52_evmTU1s1192
MILGKKFLDAAGYKLQYDALQPVLYDEDSCATVHDFTDNVLTVNDIVHHVDDCHFHEDVFNLKRTSAKDIIIFSDPPYFVLSKDRKDKSIVEWDSVQWSHETAKNPYEYYKELCAIINISLCSVSNGFLFMFCPFQFAPQIARLLNGYVFILTKSEALPGKLQYPSQSFECIVIASFDDNTSMLNPTQKPAKLIFNLMEQVLPLYQTSPM